MWQMLTDTSRLPDWFGVESTIDAREGGAIHLMGGHVRGVDVFRVRDGKVLTTDGPFAETREQLGGYYLIEAKDLDDALGIAARIPGARYGSIEVRPIWVYN